jgi:hypothetical protein
MVRYINAARRRTSEMSSMVAGRAGMAPSSQPGHRDPYRDFWRRLVRRAQIVPRASARADAPGPPSPGPRRRTRRGRLARPGAGGVHAPWPGGSKRRAIGPRPAPRWLPSRRERRGSQGDAPPPRGASAAELPTDRG